LGLLDGVCIGVKAHFAINFDVSGSICQSISCDGLAGGTIRKMLARPGKVTKRREEEGICVEIQHPPSRGISRVSYIPNQHQTLSTIIFLLPINQYNMFLQVFLLAAIVGSAPVRGSP
jgi:hypothetical protein